MVTPQHRAPSAPGRTRYPTAPPPPRDGSPAIQGVAGVLPLNGQVWWGGDPWRAASISTARRRCRLTRPRQLGDHRRWCWSPKACSSATAPWQSCPGPISTIHWSDCSRCPIHDSSASSMASSQSHPPGMPPRYKVCHAQVPEGSGLCQSQHEAVCVVRALALQSCECSSRTSRERREPSTSILNSVSCARSAAR